MNKGNMGDSGSGVGHIVGIIVGDLVTGIVVGAIVGVVVGDLGPGDALGTLDTLGALVSLPCCNMRCWLAGTCRTSMSKFVPVRFSNLKGDK